MDVSNGKRLTRKEALGLLQNESLLTLGRMAFDKKRARHGDSITFVRNLHINPTNLCVYSCKFCDFAAKKGDAHAYELEEDAIVHDVSDAPIKEVHIVGGLWPKWGLSRSLDLVRRIREVRPDLWIKAFTAVEVAYFARMDRMDLKLVLLAMKEAGVDSMTGGGAEVLSHRIHQELYSDKIGPEKWLDVHGAAHDIGLPSNATLLFGHIETGQEIIEHLFLLRELQDKTAGFQSFIPLAYQPGRTQLIARMASVPRCLRIIAMSRLVLDNIPHIKAYWPTLQIETAVAALNFGADDLDGTLGTERIMQMACTESPAELSTAMLERMIVQAGQQPIERDGAYNIVDTPAPSAAAVGASASD